MMKPWIQNISLEDCKTGNHYDPGPNSLLIQIVDYDTAFPMPKYQFKEVHQFKFLDVEDTDVIKYGHAITDEQAATIAKLLTTAFDNHTNIVVHCHYGICRSGAVAEVGVMLGFRDTEVFRQPNLMVKHKLLAVLGLQYTPSNT